LKDARRAAAEALIAVERGAYANLALKEILPAVAESNGLSAPRWCIPRLKTSFISTRSSHGLLMG
jgi:hypothetical protein